MNRLIVAALLFGIPFSAIAQSQSTQQRRDALARVQELVNDPDPLTRIANFEEIVAEGDAAKLQIAIRIGLSGNDSQLRGLAFRAYLGGVGRFAADLSLQPELQKKLAVARQQDEKERRNFFRAYSYLDRLISNTAMRGDVRITQFDFRSGRGKASTSWDRQEVNFQVNGVRFIATVGINGVSRDCILELRPTKSLLIEGHLVCQRVGFGQVKVTAPMF